MKNMKVVLFSGLIWFTLSGFVPIVPAPIPVNDMNAQFTGSKEPAWGAPSIQSVFSRSMWNTTANIVGLDYEEQLVLHGSLYVNSDTVATWGNSWAVGLEVVMRPMGKELIVPIALETSYIRSPRRFPSSEPGLAPHHVREYAITLNASSFYKAVEELRSRSNGPLSLRFFVASKNAGKILGKRPEYNLDDQSIRDVLVKSSPFDIWYPYIVLHVSSDIGATDSVK